MKTQTKKLITAFYDSLATDYHLIYQDWERAIVHQSQFIDQLLQDYLPTKPKRILDCTCGIGTQALGLSQLGYEVYGTDLSAASITRAKQEAQKRKLSIIFEAVDLRKLQEQVAGQFEAILSFDNALPHLIEAKELLKALQNIRAKMQPQGVFLGSMRDYDALLPQKPQSTPPVSKQVGDQQTLSFQIWHWQPDDTYSVDHFTIKGQGENYTTKVRKMVYHAYTRAAMEVLFKAAGFKKVDWLMPEETGFYQPVFVCRG